MRNIRGLKTFVQNKDDSPGMLIFLGNENFLPRFSQFDHHWVQCKSEDKKFKGGGRGDHIIQVCNIFNLEKSVM